MKTTIFRLEVAPNKIPAPVMQPNLAQSKKISAVQTVGTPRRLVKIRAEKMLKKISEANA